MPIGPNGTATESALRLARQVHGFLHCADMPTAVTRHVTGPDRTRVHLLIPTHTPRHLDTCLAAVSLQTDPPDTVAVTCDTDAQEIERLLGRVWPLVAHRLRSLGRREPRLLYVARPYQNEPRLNQVRNNGLRAMLDSGAEPADQVVTIDGDMALSPEAIANHRALAARGSDVVVAFRVNLTEATTRSIRADDVLAESEHAWMALDAGQREAMSNRDRRCRRQLFFRRALPWLSKAHKPKLLGGHHAVRLGALLAVNGYDEQFVGYGYDDDDLARRLHRLGGLSWSIAVAMIPAFHLWHPTRAPSRPTDAPGYSRFRRRDLPARTERGIENPLAQPAPNVMPVPDESQVLAANASRRE